MSSKEYNTPKYTNRLIHESSPYLLKHAHNPVDWYPWGPEALAKAKAENKPILLSIGYTACHWCNVMERESFENEEIARLMNENFICIKVDREERPDLDNIYMNAVQMMTRHGGWPLTVFLTPDQVPFYGGTYFPPEDRHGMPGFRRILLAVADAYRNRSDEIKQTTEELLRELRSINRFRRSGEILTQDILNNGYWGLLRSFDNVNGGFGAQPKFPPSMSLEFLLRTYHRAHRQEALDMVELTLKRMACGGIYDHLGGGFHRYSVDAHWLVPHFEKMLYDNALLSRIYLHAYQATGNRFYRRIAEEIFDYVLRDMTDPKGGFYSTEDADSEGEEGKFYVWTPDEIKAALGDRDGELLCHYFDVTRGGNFEHGKSILNIPRDLEKVARDAGISEDELSQVIERGRKRLFEVREKRIRPARDEKVLTAWNALMMASFAEGSRILRRDDYRQAAEHNAEFILSTLRRDGRLLRVYKDGEARLNGYLEDYAYLIDALITLYEADFDLRWFEEARKLADAMIEEFWDDTEGGLFFTGKSHEELISRTKDFFDNAIPSGNSVAAYALLKLGVLTGESEYINKATTIFRLTEQVVSRYPSGFGRMLSALDFYLSTPKEVAIIGYRRSPDTQKLVETVYNKYLPNKVLALAEPEDERAPQLIALLKGRRMIDGKATAYVCERYTCQTPVTGPAELVEQLEV